MTTNPTPSLGLSSKDSPAPSQAALAAADNVESLMMPTMSTFLSIDACRSARRLMMARAIDAPFAQLAETNGKALARAEASLAEERRQAIYWEKSADEWRQKYDGLGAYYDTGGRNAELKEQLAQSQAREASLAALLARTTTATECLLVTWKHKGGSVDPMEQLVTECRSALGLTQPKPKRTGRNGGRGK